MLLLRNLVPWLLLACLAQQVSVSTGARDGGRGRKGKGGGKPEQPPPPAPTTPPAPGERERGAEREKERGGENKPAKGKFTTKDKMQCTWAARGEDTVTLGVSCRDPAAGTGTGTGGGLSCDYTARPAACPGFGTNPAGYWKQVARALKKLQRKLCKDHRALVRAGMCKRAPQDAHFRLAVGSNGEESLGLPESRPVTVLPPRTTEKTTKTPQTTKTPKIPKIPKTTKTTTAKTTTTPATDTTTLPTATSSACTNSTVQRKLADEYCSSSWASLCTFFFSMVQSGDC